MLLVLAVLIVRDAREDSFANESHVVAEEAELSESLVEMQTTAMRDDAE